MSSYPDWAWPSPASQNGQVSRGLNLVLELKPKPNRLPLLLWDIVLAQDKIKRALADLSFVHFARFVPSWDGRALMVTTEFDGPLDPYVLDFVIALGDVFDTLLGYVQAPPTLPVREHPDEFLAWVRKWNRVPFYPGGEEFKFPEGFDYPIYSAYPTKTVTDIVGARDARTELPLAAIDRPAANVDPADVQGNILNGYNARHARYLFFSIADAAAARRWLAQELPKAGTPWLGVASAAPWADGTPPVLTQVALSHDGLTKLLPPARQADLMVFPKAFREGAAARADENFDRGNSRPEKWMFGGPTTDPVHVVLFLYTREEPPSAAYTAAVQALETGAAKGLKYLCTHSGMSIEGPLVGEERVGYEHFGFRDGLSQPRISGQCPVAAPAFQPSASPGEFLLHKDFKSIYGGSSLGEMPQGLAGNGSFGVLRLMEQHTAVFRESTDREARRLGTDADRLRAKLMGRWPEGDPLSLVHHAPPPGAPPKAADTLNSFDYAPSWEFPAVENDHQGLHCPVGAHIRRANPRTARVAGQRHSRRLLRRGMPAQWQEGGVDKVGLMGLFLGANIEQQFEFIQREWLQGDLAASGIRGTTDPIAAVRSTLTEFHFLEPHPDCSKLPPIRLTAKIPPLVTTRGCVYLLFPGLKALRALDAASSPMDEEDVAVDQSKAPPMPGAKGAKRAKGGKAISKGAKAVARTAAKAVKKVSDLLRLPDVDLDQLISSQPLLDQWIKQPVLKELAEGKWREFVKALIERKLDSPQVKELIDSFSPPPVEVKPSIEVDQGGIDLADRRFLADPYPVLKELREVQKKRIVWVREQQAYWLLDHAGCKELLHCKTHFGQTQSDTPFAGVVTLDEPRHKVVRAALDVAFTAALAELDSEKISVTVDLEVAALLGQTHPLQFDFMQAFARPVARSVIWQLIGIDAPAQRHACDALAQTMTLNFGKGKGPGTVARMVFADAGLRLAARLAPPLGDAWARSFLPGSPYKGTLIGELAARMAAKTAGLERRPLGFIETLMTLVQTVLASQSPHFLLSNAALHLLQPDPRRPTDPLPWKQLADLGSGPDFDTALQLALDEARRHEPPLTLIERYAKGSQEICGVKVPDNCPVFAMVASGNRDVAVFGANPEEFHADRAEASIQLSLGHGIHECAGKAVQNKLVTAALGRMIQAMPDLRLSNPTAVPAWYPTIYFRELQALSVARCPP